MHCISYIFYNCPWAWGLFHTNTKHTSGQQEHQGTYLEGLRTGQRRAPALWQTAWTKVKDTSGTLPAGLALHMANLDTCGICGTPLGLSWKQRQRSAGCRNSGVVDGYSILA